MKVPQRQRRGVLPSGHQPVIERRVGAALDGDHLPAPIAARFRELVAAAAAASEAQQARDAAAPVDCDKADQVLAAATADVDQAFTRRAEETAGVFSSISDSAAAAYVWSIGKVQEALAAALAAVKKAQHALALSRRVQPGWPVVDATSTRLVCGNCRSGTT